MENTVKNKNRGFGIKSMIASCSIKNLIEEVVFSGIVSWIMLKLVYAKTEDTYALVCKVVDVSLTIIPAMIALMLTAYVFVMSFLYGKSIVDAMKNPQRGESLLYKLNASFGISLLLNVSAVIVFFIIYCIAQVNISVEYADIINNIVLCGVTFVVVLSIIMQIGIIIDLFNCGQVLVRNSYEEKHTDVEENQKVRKQKTAM